MNKGHWYAIGAYGLWGLFPIYWKWLHQVPALQILGHRIVWSFLCLAVLILLSRQGRSFIQAVWHPRVMAVYVPAAGLITINWLTFVWAVTNGFVVETSLGYFINPLLSILLGVFFLRERLRPMQWVSIVLAALGILYLTLQHGSLPWIALVLAFSWAAYGLIKKIAPLGALQGLTLETGILLLPVTGYMIYVEEAGEGIFGHGGLITDLLLFGAGPVTTLPLGLFAAAARRIPLSHMGFLQYIVPTLQFLVGVLIFREEFSFAKLIGFVLVWIALILLVLEGYLIHRAFQKKGERPGEG
jgi:chloramphenicol-sensitive protein RarD